MSRSPRFEIVRTDAGWLGRFIASNGKEVWRTSEIYQRRRGVERAIQFLGLPEDARDVDERTAT